MFLEDVEAEVEEGLGRVNKKECGCCQRPWRKFPPSLHLFRAALTECRGNFAGVSGVFFFPPFFSFSSSIPHTLFCPSGEDLSRTLKGRNPWVCSRGNTSCRRGRRRSRRRCCSGRRGAQKMTDSGEEREKKEGRELNLETEEGEGHRFSMSGKKKKQKKTLRDEKG